MSTELLPAPATPQTELALQPELVHVCCCDNHDIGLCGIDLSAHHYTPWASTSCLVCANLEEMECADACPLNARKEAA